MNAAAAAPCPPPNRISKEPLPLRADEQVGCLGAQGMQGGHQVLQAGVL